MLDGHFFCLSGCGWSRKILALHVQRNWLETSSNATEARISLIQAKCISKGPKDSSLIQQKEHDDLAIEAANQKQTQKQTTNIIFLRQKPWHLIRSHANSKYTRKQTRSSITKLFCSKLSYCSINIFDKAESQTTSRDSHKTDSNLFSEDGMITPPAFATAPTHILCGESAEANSSRHSLT